MGLNQVYLAGGEGVGVDPKKGVDQRGMPGGGCLQEARATQFEIPPETGRDGFRIYWYGLNLTEWGPQSGSRSEGCGGGSLAHKP